MRKKPLIRHIFVFLILAILLFIPLISASNGLINNPSNCNEIPEGLWFVRGLFKYMGEDEDYIYLRTIAAHLTGVRQGLMSYSLRFPISIKIYKPFYGFLPSGSIPLPGLGLCKKWEYTDSDYIENEKESDSKNIISNKYHIELDGYFGKAYHLLYFKNPNNQVLSLMMSIIRFDDAKISINNDEFCNDDDGILFVCLYNGIYNHDSDEDTLTMNGDAWYLKVLLV
jgi:hypothetical protein